MILPPKLVARRSQGDPPLVHNRLGFPIDSDGVAASVRMSKAFLKGNTIRVSPTLDEIPHNLPINRFSNLRINILLLCVKFFDQCLFRILRQNNVIFVSV